MPVCRLSATGSCKAEECPIPATAVEDRLLDTQEARAPSLFFQLLTRSLTAIVAISQRGISPIVSKLHQNAAVQKFPACRSLRQRKFGRGAEI